MTDIILGNASLGMARQLRYYNISTGIEIFGEGVI
jgi:hypothetical protein